MSVASVESDLDNLTLTVIADFDAPVEAVWELWADPQKLGLWWGPPNYSTTFEPYEMSVGAEMAHVFAGPNGEAEHGVWRIEAVDPPRTSRRIRCSARTRSPRKGRPRSRRPSARTG